MPERDSNLRMKDRDVTAPPRSGGTFYHVKRFTVTRIKITDFFEGMKYILRERRMHKK